LETKATGKRVLALDLVEAGSSLSDGEVKKAREHLPDGITSGMLYKDILHIAWPALMELALTQLVSMADMMMVGGLGHWAISAVGLTTQPKFLLMTIFMALNVGATALVARYRGAGDSEKANAILRQAFIMTFIVSFVSSVLGFIFARPMVAFMGAETEQTLIEGTVYLKIQMAGLTVVGLTSTITACLRGVGDSKTAMIYNLTANIVNVFFNWLLINGNMGFPALGVAEASIATVIGQTVAFIMAMVVIIRGKRFLALSFKEGFKLQWSHIKSIINIGIPSAIEQLIMRAGMILYTLTVTSLGDMAYAIHQIALNILGMSFMLGQAFAVSATSLTGQCLGKKRTDMAEAYGRRTRRSGMIVSIVIGVIFFFFGGSLTWLYNKDPFIVDQGAQIMRLVAFIIPFQTSQFILAGALRGAGDTRATAVISLLTVLAIRPGLSFVFINFLHFGVLGAWFALGADQLLRSVLVIARYNSGKWKHIKV
jgi:putative MATE family efflux protein